MVYLDWSIWGQGMDTLSIAQTLEEAGFKKAKAVVIAQLLDRQDNMATKDFVHAEIASLSNRMYIAAITLAGVIVAAVKFL